MKKNLLLSAVIASALVSGISANANAASVSLKSLIDSHGTITSDDGVIYSDFQIEGAGPIGTGGAEIPSYANTFVSTSTTTPGQNGEAFDANLNFTSSDLNVMNGQTQDLPISYRVTAPGGYLIDGISNLMNGMGVSGRGNITISETAVDANNMVLASLVNNSSTGGILQTAQFAAPVSTITALNKDISLVAPGQGSMAHLSYFGNDVSLVPVPEPMTYAGGALALGLGFLVRRKTRLTK